MFATDQSIFLRVPAKVNLYLEILGTRPDGYHDLRSVVMPIGLYDHLELAADAGGLSLTVRDDSPGREAAAMSADDDNLVLRAARALKQATGFGGGARIALTKRIPIGGGLGGGSADAAATLIGLNRLWGTGLSIRELMPIGATLGCDVPALLCGAPVLMEGRGERVTPIEISNPAAKRWWLVLANPEFNVSTADIYSRCTSVLTSRAIPIKSMVSSVTEGDIETAARSLFNGLETIVFRKYPVIEMIAEGMQKAGALGTLLSGSGASVFGLASTEAHALEIERKLAGILGFSPWTAVVETLPDGVMVAHGPLEA